MTSLIDGFVSHLEAPAMDLRSKLNIAAELRDSIELNTITPDQEHFVTQLLPQITRLLEQTPVSLVALSPEHKLRHCLLDCIARIQPNEALKPAAPSIMQLVLRVLQTDNEENGIVCLRIFSSLHRAYKGALSDFVQPFFELVTQLITHAPVTIHELFDSEGAEASANASEGTAISPNPDNSSTDGSAPQKPGTSLVPASKSFKVLIECPIIVVLLFTTHRAIVTQALPSLVPHMMELLSLEAGPQAREHAKATARGTHFVGCAPAIRASPHRQVYHDFVVSQIKFMSFIAFLFRAFSPALQQHLPLIPNFLVRLLKDCPTENSHIRKELVVGLRHMIGTEHRMLFLSKVNTLLEEKVLLGYGLTSHMCIKPIALSATADLIHHGRNELSVAQIWSGVRTYTKCLLDPQMVGITQTMCLKLLMNIMERLSTVPKPEQSRPLLMLVLKSVVDRFVLINNCFSESEKAVRKSQLIIKMQSEIPHSDIKEAKFVYRNLVMFMRNFSQALKASNPPSKRGPIPQWNDFSRVFSVDETYMLRKLLRESLRGLKMFENEETPRFIEIIDSLTFLFMQLDPATFNEIIGLEIDFLVKIMMQGNDYMRIGYLFSGSEATSCGYCTTLLRYLMQRLPDLDKPEGVAIAKLFRQCFSSVVLFPAVNEPVILTVLRDLIVGILECSNDSPDPSRFFYVLEHLFRILGGGLFDNVYKTVLPLLHFLMETLNKRLAASTEEKERNLYAKLCLTVPVRLSLMIPHLSFLMKPMLQAISTKISPELVAQGLRALELCVDNLTASYFDPHIQPILPELFPVLWGLLKPLPADHKLSHATLRILGKLGGRSRAYITPPKDLEHITYLNQDIKAIVQMNGADLAIRITPGIKIAMKVLEAPLNAYEPIYRHSAFNLISVVLMRHIPPEIMGETDIEEPAYPNDKKQRQLETELVDQLFCGLFLACNDPELREKAQKLIENVCDHVVKIENLNYERERQRALRPMKVDENEGKLYIAPRTAVSGVIFGLSHRSEEVNDSALKAIRYIISSAQSICPDTEPHQLPMFRGLFAKLSHSCFEESWHVKLGAIRGLNVILGDFTLNKSWLDARTIELTRTLFFVIKDTSPVGGYTTGNVPSLVSKEAAKLLMYTLTKVNHVPTEQYFSTLVGLLAFELEDACGYCRSTSQDALKFLSESTGIGLSEILQKATDVFLTPIFMKPLRALPFPMQIGYSDCISYCLSIPNTFLKFNDKLTRMLEEALALVDADDESLTTAQRVYEYTTGQQLTELRVVCIKMLSQAIIASELHPSLKARIIAVFFKSMSGGSQPVVDAAYEGLKSVLQVSGRLPKELLQTGLRPILLPLSDFKRLNPNVLDCLTRLLELLTYNFKVEIGTKLLDLLRTFSEPQRLLPLSSKVLEGDSRVKLGVSLINVFHMLPPTAHIFLADLIGMVLNIEDTLRRAETSPFREPTAKFIQQYPSHSYALFIEKINDTVYGRFFVDMVTRSPAFKALINMDELLAKVAQIEEERTAGICNLIALSKVVDVSYENLVELVKRTKELGGDLTVKIGADNIRDVVIKFLDTAVIEEIDSSSKIEEESDKMDVEEPEDDKMDVDESEPKTGESTGKTSTEVAEKDNEKDNEKKSEPIKVSFSQYFDLVVLVSHPQITQILYKKIVAGELRMKQLWLEHAIPLVVRHDVSPAAKQYIMLISNMTLMVYGEEHENLNALIENSTWLQSVHTQIWQNADQLIPPEGTMGNPYGSGLGVSTLDMYFIQLLQMSVLLVMYASTHIFDMRKNVIKFGWRYITVDDAFSKLSAYVLVNYFVKAFDTLPKIVVQIYFALLKTQNQEARSLVQQSLDELATVLVQRVSVSVWARAPRRVLSEEGQGILGVSNVCLFLTRHAKLFYPYRELYVQYIVSSLARLSSMPHQSLDVDFAELLASWEKQRAEEDNKEGFEMAENTRDSVITYLVRFITAQPAGKNRDSGSVERVLASLDTLLGVWPKTTVTLSFFDRVLSHSDFSASPQVLHAALDALTVVKLAIKHKSEEWISENIEEIGKLLEKPLMCSIVQIHEAIVPILQRTLPVSQELTRQVVVAAVEHANAGTRVWVDLAKEAVAVQPTCLDEHMPVLVKAMSKMVKDSATVNTSGTPANQPTNTPATANNNGGTITPGNAANGAVANNANPNQLGVGPSLSQLLIVSLELVASRISHLGDQRRSFLTLVAHVIERMHDKNVCQFILKMVRGWVFGSEPFPTTKEKAAILHKLLAYKDPELVEQYFDIIVDVFETKRSTELPSRLEQPFLVGCCSSNVKVRNKLLTILSDSVDKSVIKRLIYALCEQNWEPLADHMWLCQALQLLLEPLKQNQKLVINVPVGFSPLVISRKNDVKSPKLELVDSPNDRTEFMNEIENIPASEFVQSIQTLLFLDNEFVKETWLDVFISIFKSPEFASKDRHEFVKGLVMVLSKEYHMRQADARPNVIQCLLEGLASAGEQVPPQLTKYLALNYDTWYTSIQICENILNAPQSDSMAVAEVNMDVLAELYASLGEDDHFYGLWRTRSKFSVTSAALSYEQCGMWQKAMQLHETAQIRARCGALPYGESEYGLWEDHWILCAEKLQHWEVLTDIAKHEGFTDLLLECQWRLADWMTERETLAATIKTVMDVPTPRRQVFETFLSLQGFAQKTDTLQHLSQNCDEGIQLALRKWHSLPARFTQAHAPLLHTFQQYVEFMEATQVYTSLQNTNTLNIESKSNELRGVMQAWHDRLPNAWDDINWWGDLAAWRQHVFGVINRVYHQLIPQLQQPQATNIPCGSAAYRGYHEIAWTINRFAHTARKQNLTEVCTTQLSKIYTLPNIEIHEAFLKLREQAKCHLQNPNELATGLDVISNTNLVFFGNSQKAEFFTLKGETLAKLGQNEHAYNVLSTAVQVDMHLPNAWDAWGDFSDRRFKENPEDFDSGASAITCYLHAISLYKNRKSRKLIGRLLWLLGLEDPEGKLGEAFEEYQGDTPTWYWITYIPQMLTSLSTAEGRYTSQILVKIAKTYPQALHFQLRTAREEYSVMRKFAPKESGENAAFTENKNEEAANGEIKEENKQEDSGEANGSGSGSAGSGIGNSSGNGSSAGAASSLGSSSSSTGSKQKYPIKQPWEYTEEIMGVLKTAYPLLALSLETLIDQMSHRFKSPADEDVYRLIVALLNDVLSYVGRRQVTRADEALPASMEANIVRFAEGVINENVRPQFEADFVNPKPKLDEYIQRLRKWRDRLEDKLDARPYRVNLESLSPLLGEFHYQKFEEVEIPGQSLELTDDNHHFLKIGRFVPHAELVRGYGVCYRRITIEATDGSRHTFAIQYPAARNVRREDRVTQIFKILNCVMQQRTETRRRNLQFTLPNAVSLNIHIRLVQDDPNYISFYQIYEKFCRENNQPRDAPFDYQIEQMRQAIDPNLPKPDTSSIKVEIMSAIQAKLVPKTIMRNYFLSQYRSFEDFWLFRKQFAYQYAAVSFMTVMMSVNSRYPHKFNVNLSSGNIWAMEMLPVVYYSNKPPTYLNGESVAFRLTPNLQELMGQHVIEGIFGPVMMIIAKSITENEFDLQQFLPLFVRDELISWFANQLNPEHRFPKGIANKQQMQEVIKSNVETICRRAASLCQTGPPNSVADQTALDLISLAVNPRNLAPTDILWMPYY